jgi:allophanate hydrolase
MPDSHRQNNIRSLLGAYRRGERDPRAVAEEVIAQLERHQSNPIFIYTMPAAAIRQRAEALAGLSEEERRKLPLFGVPFAVKDNIDVAGLPTSAGCPQYAYTAEQSAFAVQRLLTAGALLVGKTNLDQFATGLTGMRSPYGGPINPYSAQHIVGGSSSGSAVAVSTGIVHFALGTDTAGSGRIPAGFNNVVGFKASKGVISNTGVVPCCPTLDCVSIFANHLDDARIVLSVMAEYDPADPFARPHEPAAQAISSPVIGILESSDEHFFGDDMARRAYDQGIEQLATLGYAMEYIDFQPFAEVSAMTYFGPWMAERAAVLGDFIDSHPDADYIPVVRDAIMGSRDFSAVDAHKSFYRLKALDRTTQATWRKVDFLCLPTAPSIYSREWVAENPAYASTSLGRYTNFANLLDLNAVSVPNILRDDGLPNGMMFVGPRFSENALISIAEIFEKRIRQCDPG